ncbi:MAG: VanW family protein [Polyangiaceae bacterium]
MSAPEGDAPTLEPSADSPEVSPAAEPLPAAARLRPRWMWIACALLPCVLPVFGFGLDRLASLGEVQRGVSLGSLALSGLNHDEATARVAPLGKRVEQGQLKLGIGANLLELDAETIGARCDVEQSVGRAFAAGRSGGVGSQFVWWLESFARGHTVDLAVTLDDARFEAELSRLEQTALAHPPFEGAVVLQGDQLVSKPPAAGWVVDHAATREAVLAAFADGSAHGARFARAELVRREPRVTAGEVDAALALANSLVKQPIHLENSEEEVEVKFTVRELKSSVRTRPAPSGGLEVYFDPTAVEKKLEPLRKNLEDEPKNARFVAEGDRVRIEPSRPGTLLDAAAVAKELETAARAGQATGKLPIQRSAPPSFTTEDAEALGIKGLVSSFTTYHACCQKRVQNIHLIADLLNDTIVKPGERFSVNEYIGPRTHGKGFVEAPTISRGEMVDSYGGGISQFATTMFNAVLDGAYEIIQRQPHSYYFTRYPEGHEATLSFPVPDLIFRNDTQAGMLIKTEYGSTFIRVKIYGDNGGRKVRRIVSRRFDIVKPDVEYEADDKLDPEKEKVLYGGMDGWSVVATRIITYPDGKKNEEGRKVVYKPRTRIVKVHPCKIPKGFEGYTGDRCPEPEEPDAGAPEGEDQAVQEPRAPDATEDDLE